MIKTRKDFTSDEDYQHYLYVRKTWKKNKYSYMWEVNVKQSKDNLIDLIQLEEPSLTLEENLKYYFELLETREKYRKYYNLGEYE